MSGYKCLRIQGEGITLDVLGQGWRRSVLSGSGQRLGSCSQDLCWVGFWSHIFVHLNRGSQVLSDSCHRRSAVDLEQTHYTFAISIVVSYEWFLSRDTTDSSVYPGRGRKVHTLGRSFITGLWWWRLGVGASGGTERRSQHNRKINRYVREEEQSITIGFQVLSMSVGKMKSLCFCKNID